MKINITDNRKSLATSDSRFKTKWETTPKVHSVVNADKLTSTLKPR